MQQSVKINRKYINVASLSSTNSRLKAMLYAEKEPAFYVLRAETQTGGRGRTGKSFVSPPGGLYFSAAFPLTGEEKNIPFLTLAAGLCTSRETDKAAHCQTLIKWPNDIYLNGKKICGILTELIKTPFGLCAVTGIGINLSTPASAFDAALKDKCASLLSLGFTPPDADLLMKSIVQSLDTEVYKNGVLCSSAAAVAEINKKNYLLGRRVSFISDGKTCEGEAADIKENGALGILTENGAAEKVCTGEIILL